MADARRASVTPRATPVTLSHAIVTLFTRFGGRQTRHVGVELRTRSLARRARPPPSAAAGDPARFHGPLQPGWGRAAAGEARACPAGGRQARPISMPEGEMYVRT